MAQDRETNIPEFGNLRDSVRLMSTSLNQPGWTRKKILLTLGILTALTGAAFALTLYVLKPILAVKVQPVESHTSVMPPLGKILPLDPAIVNIAGTDGHRYLKATIQIEIPDDENLMKEVQARKAILSDRLIRILSSTPLEELIADGSLDRLKQQITNQFSQDLGANRLRAVYLTEFVIQ